MQGAGYSFYKRSNKKKDQQKELLEEYLEKRAQAKRRQQEMLNEKAAKMEQERSRLTKAWNSERQMAKASNAYDANILSFGYSIKFRFCRGVEFSTKSETLTEMKYPKCRKNLYHHMRRYFIFIGRKSQRYTRERKSFPDTLGVRGYIRATNLANFSFCEYSMRVVLSDEK